MLSVLACFLGYSHSMIMKDYRMLIIENYRKLLDDNLSLSYVACNRVLARILTLHNAVMLGSHVLSA